MTNKEKIVVGFYEDVVISGKTIRAKIDTGASGSSLDSNLVELLGLGPVVGRKAIINTHGRRVRPVIMAKVNIAGKEVEAKFNIATREHLRYSILIGKNILRQGFLIDPKKKLIKSEKKIIKNTKDLLAGIKE